MEELIAHEHIVEKKACSVCESERLECTIHLPEFPLTGIFVNDHTNLQVPRGYDQELLVCYDCGHVQLGYVLPPEKLYGSTYLHRSSVSHIAPSASSFFAQYVDSLSGGRTFDCILEVGCNDMLLLNQMASRGQEVIGIDPIWKDQSPDVAPNMRIIGALIEDVDFETQMPTKPDLIFSTHNLEHINEPLEQFSRLVDFVDEGALFVIEVPDIDSMIDNLRFDQVFHQHLHYFGLASLERFIERVGGEYIGHNFNFKNWGGSLSIAFRKGEGKSKSSVTFPAFRTPKKELIIERYEIFRQRMSGFMKLVEGLRWDIWGYGAGQMVPSVAYNLGSDLSFLKGIFDDDPSRSNLAYPHLPVRILQPSSDLYLRDSVVMITALDGVRAIVNRLRQFNPRFIIAPIDVF